MAGFRPAGFGLAVVKLATEGKRLARDEVEDATDGSQARSVAKAV